MNKKSITSIFIRIAMLLLLGFQTFGAHSKDIEVYKYGMISEDLLTTRLHEINSNNIIDIKITSELKKIIKQYTVTSRSASESVLGMIPHFFPLFETTLKNNNLPEELKYLSIIESGLKPTAQSKVGAAGLWQFMKGTGKMYGLQINSTVDQRRDPVKSTEAAAKYLKDLYRQFDNWTLALAAYNCGPGNVRKAIKKSKSKDYWQLQKYLPRETRRYIPKFIAMMYLVNFYDAHDLVPKLSKVDFKNLMRIPVDSKINFRELSTLTGLSIQEIKIYNPSYIKNYIPGNKGEYYINLPQEVVWEFITVQQNKSKVIHSFAGDYYTDYTPKSVTINKDNSITTIDLLTKNQSIKKIVYMEKHILLPSTIYQPASYRLKKGETISIIAQRKNISIEKIVQINHIDLNHTPLPGSMIILP